MTRLRADNEEGPVPRHARCQLNLNPAIITEGTQSIRQSQLDFLNWCRLAIIPEPAVSIETSCETAKLAQLQLVTSMTLEQKFSHLKMLETLAVQMHLVLLPRDRDKIQAELSKRDKEKFKEAGKARKKNEDKTPHKTSVEAKRMAKAIDELTSVGIPYTAAFKTVYDNELKKGTTAPAAYRMVFDAMLSLNTAESEVERLLSEQGIKES
jgi:hypothetical protein